MSKSKELHFQAFDKINPLIRFSVTRYVMAISFFLAIVVFGFISTTSLGVDLLPNFNIPVVVVTTQYPGATPKVVDEQITQTVENAVSITSGIIGISSTSSTGMGRTIIMFDPNIDKNVAATQISTRMAAAMQRFPTGISAPTIQTFDPNAQSIVEFGIISQGSDMEKVGLWALNDLAPLLESLSGVANVQVTGQSSRQFQVLLDPNRLQFYKINPQQVSAAIANSAVNNPIGKIISNQNSITFSTNNIPNSTEEVAQILVDSNRGISVKDLSSVRDMSVPTNYVRINGQPAILISIRKNTDSNSVAVAQSIREFFKTYSLPSEYSLLFSNDTTGPISASINSTFHEFIVTMFIVAIICLLSLGKINTTFAVVLAIPISLAASPILYFLCGFSFNQVSLLAMIVAIGIVVDDSIVVAENVERYKQMGYSSKEAVLRGSSEVFSAALAATLSLLSVLLPISFLGGIIGRYIIQFSLGLAVAVFLSLLEALLFLTVRLAYTPDSKILTWSDFFTSFTQVPQALKWGLASWKKGPFILIALIGIGTLLYFRLAIWTAMVLVYPLLLSIIFYLKHILLCFLQSLTMVFHNITERCLVWIRELYVRSLNWVMRFAGFVLVGAAGLFISTFFFVKIPFNFVSLADSGALNVTLRLPSTTPDSITNEAGGKIEAWLLKQPEVATVQSVISLTEGSSSMSANTNMVVQLIPIEQRRKSFLLAKDYRSALLPLIKDYPSPRLSVSSAAFGGASGSTISLVLGCSNFQKLRDANQKVVNYFLNHPHVVDVNSSLSNVIIENNFIPDPVKLKGTGIDPTTAALALQIYTSGIQSANVEIEGLDYPIWVQANPIFISNSRSLLNLPVYSPAAQTSFQVGQLGQFVLTETPTNINRNNRTYAATFDINMKSTDIPALVFQDQVVEEMTHLGILDHSLTFGPANRLGPTAMARELQIQAMTIFSLALFLVYLVMGSQFNSWKYPIYLLIPVPLAIVGALWIVSFTGSGLDIFGGLGMIMLIGLSAKNSIIYLDFVMTRLQLMPLKDALTESARLRFRPIIMTTLTVLVISFPLIFSEGQGSEFGRTMGVVMFGGIISSAILTFFVVPAAFWFFEKNHFSIQPPTSFEK